MPKAPCLSRKRKRKPKDFELVESRFFKKPVLLLPPPPPPPSPKSCPSSPRIAVTLASPQMDKAQPMIVRLVNSRPFLIQSLVGYDLWLLIIVVTLLNKTTGKKAIPVFFDIIRRWPTPYDLAQACISELESFLRPLGLSQVRSTRLIKFSNMYTINPPSPFTLHKSRVQAKNYPSTPISHYPGVGRYCLDSYFIFHVPNGWQNVQPLDKELRAYVRWRWAVAGFAYDYEEGVVGPASEEYLDKLCSGLL